MWEFISFDSQEDIPLKELFKKHKVEKFFNDGMIMKIESYVGENGKYLKII